MIYRNGLEIFKQHLEGRLKGKKESLPPRFCCLGLFISIYNSKVVDHSPYRKKASGLDPPANMNCCN